MATKKKSVTTFLSEEQKELLEQYMVENKIWSHSSALSTILENYLKSKTK